MSNGNRFDIVFQKLEESLEEQNNKYAKDGASKLMAEEIDEVVELARQLEEIDTPPTKLYTTT